jgi:hypothetical protein
MQQVSYTEKESGRFRRGQGWKVNLFGQNSDVPTEELQAFRVDMNAHMVLQTHLHIVDQFQVFIAGSGSINRQRVEMVTAHYADHHTAYGPLIAGEQGMSYLTLRPKTDAGMITIPRPDIRDHLQPTKRRHRTSAPITLSIPPVMQHRAEIAVETVMEGKDGDEGMTCLVYRLGADQSVQAPELEGTGGYYVVVMNGTLVADDEALAPWSLLFVAPHDAAPLLLAGPDGVELLVTVFPLRDAWMQKVGVA